MTTRLVNKIYKEYLLLTAGQVETFKAPTKKETRGRPRGSFTGPRKPNPSTLPPPKPDMSKVRDALKRIKGNRV